MDLIVNKSQLINKSLSSSSYSFIVFHRQECVRRCIPLASVLFQNTLSWASQGESPQSLKSPSTSSLQDIFLDNPSSFFQQLEDLKSFWWHWSCDIRGRTIVNAYILSPRRNQTGPTSDEDLRYWCSAPWLDVAHPTQHSSFITLQTPEIFLFNWPTFTTIKHSTTDIGVVSSTTSAPR